MLCSKLTLSVILQDLLVPEASSSWESQNDAKSCGETRSNIVDYRVPGISLSTMKHQDVRRQNKVKKLIEMFEKHQHKEKFLKDLSQKQKISRFSEESQQLLAERSSSFAKILVNINALIAILSGNSR